MACEEMKDSGTRGMGAIPAHWKIIPMKYVASLDPPCHLPDVSDDDEVSFAPMECIRNDRRIPRTAPKSNDNGTYSKFMDGDIAIAKVTPCFENGNICMMENLLNGFAFGSSELFTVRAHSIQNRFLFYCMQSPYFVDGGVAIMTGTGGLKRVSSDYMRNALIPLPPAIEQREISLFLDSKCSEIDAIITNAKSSIDEYKRWKASMIYQAVTKGLDPNADMQESGIDIVGIVPTDWQMVRLRFLCNVMTGDQDTQNAVPDGNYPFYVRSPIVERADTFTFEGESVLMAGDGVGAGKVFHHAKGKYAIHQRVYCFYNFRNIKPSFFYYYMSNLFSTEIDKGSAKSTVPSVRLPMLSNFRIALPSIQKQDAICEYLDKRTGQIDAIIAEKQSIIAELEAYRKSLIYETVTGKRKAE